MQKVPDFSCRDQTFFPYRKREAYEWEDTRNCGNPRGRAIDLILAGPGQCVVATDWKTGRARAINLKCLKQLNSGCFSHTSVASSRPCRDPSKRNSLQRKPARNTRNVSAKRLRSV